MVRQHQEKKKFQNILVEMKFIIDSGILYRRLALFLYNKMKANNITLIKKEIEN